jgi:tellurite resistance protein TerC
LVSWILRNLKRIIIALVGSTVLLVGVAMIILPGPAFLVIPAGLGILAVEFAWAREMLRRVKEQGSRVLGRNGN